MKLRKIITMGLAAIMAVSAMSISAFAANIPMRSEVDTKAASADNPVTLSYRRRNKNHDL